LAATAAASSPWEATINQPWPPDRVSAEVVARQIEAAVRDPSRAGDRAVLDGRVRIG
jgi:hypothetical protein